MSFGETINWNNFAGNNGNCMFNKNMTDQQSRKRQREDDSCEFMPLSKRINNLHLTNSLSNHPCQINGQDSSHSLDQGMSSPGSSNDSENRPNYNPGVRADQSNYYFDNKLLFELHLERIQRSGQQYPF